MSQGLMLSVLRLQQVWGLLVLGHQVDTLLYLVEVLTSVNSGNVHQILLFRYCREELRQRTRARGLCWEGPIVSCSPIASCLVTRACNQNDPDFIKNGESQGDRAQGVAIN